MVGIPGKSKGCNTCRKRKKGCDFQKPVCGQCQKLNLHCAGYGRETVWVSHSSDAGLVRRPKRQAPSNVALPDTLARSAYHEQYLGMFWQSYLPAGKAFPSEANKYLSGVWMNELYRLCPKDNGRAVRRILLAVSLTIIGRRDNTPWMTEYGIQLYGSSLATLASQLKEPDGLKDDNNYVASKLLSLYEILHGQDYHDRISQIKKWHLHIQGELAFLESRGPESFQLGFSHQLFVDGRATQIASALGTGKGSFLNQPEWKIIPWIHIPKTPKDLLIDIFAEVSDVFADLDKLRSTKDFEDFAIQRKALALKCQLLQLEWIDWGCQHAPTTPLTVSRTAQATDTFVDCFAAATIMSAYWSTGILILSALNIAQGTPNLPTLDDRTDPRVCCRKLAGLIPTFASSHAGKFGIHATVSAAIIALLYLEEVDGGFVSAEADAFYAAFERGRDGETVCYFVNNFRRRFREGGIRLFAPLATL